ncbi:MAG: hypothetical protein ACKO0Z_17325 [Betaproteobacteria bacterium]|jgi:hypothetical protein
MKNEMGTLIQAALGNATVGQLAIEIQRRLSRNTEVKIKPQWIRVQHTAHCDRLLSAESIDQALLDNLIAN